MIPLTEKSEVVFVSVVEQECILADRKVREALEQLCDVTLETFRNLWYNPKRSAKVQLRARGTKAAAGFVLHSKAIELLLAAGFEIAPKDYTPPLAYTIHENGTVTINE